MKATFVEFTGPGAAQSVEADVPPVGAGDLLIEAEVSLISIGTERSFLKQAPYYPFRPGYSLVGRVLAMGAEVTDFQIGDLVKASVHHGSLVVCDHRLVFKVPDGVAPEDAAFAPVGAMAICAVRLARIAWGDAAMIMGQGLIGLIATQVARLQGAAPLITTDVKDERLELSRRFGADIVLDARDEAAMDQVVQALPGGGLAAIVELCGGAEVIDRAISLSRRRGRIVAASLGFHVKPTAIYGEAFLKGLQLLPVYFNARPWQLRQIEVTSPLDWPIRPYDGGEYDGNEVDTSSGDFNLFMQFLKYGRVDVKPLLERELSPQDAARFFPELVTKDALGILIRWK